MHSIIEVNNMGKVFTRGRFKKVEKLVLNDINLKINQGDRLVIVGESGMGKTTLARIITGLEVPTEGEVHWLGKNLNELKRGEKKELRGKIQYVHQDPYASLHPSKTIYRIIADPLKNSQKLSGDKLYDKTKWLMELVGLTPAEYHFNKYPHHLSGGGRQRIAIARALTTEPSAIIADEPISMIDMSLRASIIELFKELNDLYDMAIVLILHDIGAAKYFTHEKGDIAILYGGEIVEIGKGERVLGNPTHPYTRVLIKSSPVADPNLARNRQIEQLRSYEVPERTPESKGCPFAHACNYYTQHCLDERPKLSFVESDHRVACHVFAKEVNHEG